MADAPGVYWFVPTFATLSLLTGILFAIAHHVFYWSLQGNAIPDGHYNLYILNTPKQELNTAVGTAFAFVVKVTLTAAVTTTYVQLFWWEIAGRAKNISLGSIDDLFSVLDNGFGLLKFWAWYRFPVLFLIASICWLLPIAAIITPATLSVKSKPIEPPHHETLHVQTPGFVSLNYVSQMQLLGNYARSFLGEPSTGNTGTGVYLYAGPSRAMENVALNVATLGNYLPFEPPGLNSTWTLDFEGPALQCSYLEGDIRNAIARNLKAATMGTTIPGEGFVHIVRTFAAWTYTWDRDTNHLQNTNVRDLNRMIMMPFGAEDGHTYTMNNGYINPGSRMPLQLYVAIPFTKSYFDSEDKKGPSTYIECRVSNAEYHTDFEFVNGDQRINTTIKAFIGPPMSGVGAVAGPGYSHSHGHADTCPAKSDELHEIDGAACSFDATLARTLSYQAVFDSFTRLLKGSISWQGETNPVVDSQVLNTVLVSSPELIAVRNMHQDASTLQQALRSSDSKKVQGLVSDPWTESADPLITGMEKLFQKIVVSSMASPELRANPASPFTQPPTNVTFLRYQNVYVYSASRLWLAYGIAIALAIFVVSTGLAGIFTSGATYSSNFSSVFRFAWGASINKEMKEEDTSAQDPLPAYLAKAKVTYRIGEKKRKEYGDRRSSSTAGQQLLEEPTPGQRPTSIATA